jgi:hypothetical protein
MKRYLDKLTSNTNCLMETCHLNIFLQDNKGEDLLKEPLTDVNNQLPISQVPNEEWKKCSASRSDVHIQDISEENRIETT